MLVEYVQEENAYFVKFPELPGCMADGSSPEEAVTNALKVKDEWLEVALETGWTIPEPTTQPQTSGRITVRALKSLHNRLNERADQEGVSLNQLIQTYLAQGLERSSFESRIDQKISELDNRISMLQQSGPRPQAHMVLVSGSFSGKTWKGLVQRSQIANTGFSSEELFGAALPSENIPVANEEMAPVASRSLIGGR